ncbi:MAG: hypothetical protein ABSA02_07110 [Trebonia sp.]|jgi:hypothetical protein
MSNWDLGFGRESADSYEPRHSPQPGGPGGAAFRFIEPGWTGGQGWPGAEDYPGDDGEPCDPEDAQDAPYPITYERDVFDGGPSWPTTPGLATSGLATSGLATPPPPTSTSTPTPPLTPPPPPRQPWPAAPPPFELFGGDPYVSGADLTPAPNLSGQPGEEPWLSDLRGPWREPGAGSRQPRWLIPAAVATVAAVIGAAFVFLTSGHPSAPAASGGVKPTMLSTSVASPPVSSPTPAPRKTAVAAAPPLTLTAAEAALAAYTTVNNSANAQRSDSELAMVETGGSYAIDAGLYQVQRADGAAPYPAFAPATATYYIPGAEPAGGPRWFVARVANAFSANPKKVTSTEYLLFTQTGPGGTWRNAVEPYLLPGADAPQIAIGGNGLATAVSVTSASLATAPGQLAGLTAASLDDAGRAVSVPEPGDLADRSDQKLWQGKLPTATVTDTHASATGSQTFALRTTNGGALVFYTDSAELTITPPAGSELRLTVPGLYSQTQALNSAGLTYLDQFASYDPPANAGVPTVLASYSGLTGKN